MGHSERFEDGLFQYSRHKDQHLLASWLNTLLENKRYTKWHTKLNLLMKKWYFWDLGDYPDAKNWLIFDIQSSTPWSRRAGTFEWCTTKNGIVTRVSLSEVFRITNLDKLTGTGSDWPCSLRHWEASVDNIQPFLLSLQGYPVWLAHNGNLANAKSPNGELENNEVIFSSTSWFRNLGPLDCRSYNPSFMVRWKKPWIRWKVDGLPSMLGR